MVEDTLVLQLLCRRANRLRCVGHGCLRQQSLPLSDRSPQGDVLFCRVSMPANINRQRALLRLGGSSNRESATPSLPCTVFSSCLACSFMAFAPRPSSSPTFHSITSTRRLAW